MSRFRHRRVVITGLGVVSPLGHEVQSVFGALCRGESGIRPIRRFDVSRCPSKIGGIVDDLDPDAIFPDRAGRRLLRIADWIQKLGLCAAELACLDARIDAGAVTSERLGVFLGAGRGGQDSTDALGRALFEGFRGASGDMDAYERVRDEVLGTAKPTDYLKQCPCLLSSYVAMRHQARGPTVTNVNLCSAGAQAIGEAAWVIARDDADVMIAGGADSMLNLHELGAFCALAAVSAKNEDGADACKPFDLRRDGCVVGEGAAVLILEEADHATRRGARVYAEVLGYGSSGDAHKVTAPPDDGAGAVLAMRQALRHAGVTPEEVGHINAHGTATLLNDRIETQAIKAVFGRHAYDIPIVSTKSMTGHLIAAAGALEAVIAAKSLDEKRVPPTRNLQVRDPDCDLDYVPEGERRLRDLRVVLSNSFAIGGSNACLVLGAS